MWFVDVLMNILAYLPVFSLTDDLGFLTGNRGSNQPHKYYLSLISILFGERKIQLLSIPIKQPGEKAILFRIKRLSEIDAFVLSEEKANQLETNYKSHYNSLHETEQNIEKEALLRQLSDQQSRIETSYNKINAFTTIIVAVKEGRKIYSNIQRTIQFLLSTNAVEVFTLFLTSIFLPQYVFLVPSQLLFINFITDSLPAISLGLEPAEKDIMDRPPRDSKLNVISLDIWAKMLYQAGIQIIIVMSVYCLGIKMYTPQVASTMAFLTINIMQLLHAVNLKTRHSIFKVNLFKNKVFNYSFVAGFALIFAVGLVSPLQNLFSLVALNLTQWLIVLAFSVAIIPIVEFAKYLVRKFGTERIK